MPKHLIRRYLPAPERIAQNPSLRFMGERLADPSLWHLNRRSASGAMFVGLWSAMMPMPFQILLAAALAIFFRVNLPLSVVLVWISNPFTLIPLLWIAYWLGSHLLGMPMLNSAELRQLLTDLANMLSHIFFSGEDKMASTRLSHHVPPILTGAIALGFISGALGYVSMRLFWRWHVVSAWRKRQEKRRRATPYQAG